MSQYAEQWRIGAMKKHSFSSSPRSLSLLRINVILHNSRMWVPDHDLFWSGLKCWCYFLDLVLISAVFSINAFKLRDLLFRAPCVVISNGVTHCHLSYPFGSNYWLGYFDDVKIISELCSVESDKLFGIGNGLRVIHSWEADLHMNAKSQMTSTVISSTNENRFLTWDIMQISTSHSNNKLNSQFEPNVVETNNVPYAVSQCHLFFSALHNTFFTSNYLIVFLAC